MPKKIYELLQKGERIWVISEVIKNTLLPILLH